MNLNAINIVSIKSQTQKYKEYFLDQRIASSQLNIWDVDLVTALKGQQ